MTSQIQTLVPFSKLFNTILYTSPLIHIYLLGAMYCISDKVAVCIAEALESNHSLQTLDIRSNQIGNVGFGHIAKLRSLESNTTSRELYLVYKLLL